MLNSLMTTGRRNDFLGNMFESFDSMFGDFEALMKSPRFSFDDSFPPLNISIQSDNNSFLLEMALTGYKKDYLKVSVDGNVITVAADVPSEEKEDTSKTYFKRRIKAASFEKRYTVPAGYDVSKTSVAFEDGLLSIEIPAWPEKDTSRVLEIQ